MKRIFAHLGALAIAVTLSACSENKKSESPFASQPAVRAADNVEDSLGAVAVRNTVTINDVEPAANAMQVVLQKSALDKEFLLQSSLIPQMPVALPSGNRSRVVSFVVKNEKLFLVEATNGHSSSADIPQNIILAELPIVSQDATSITFDFNSGMSNLFIAGEWAAKDIEGAAYNPDAAWVSVPAVASYIESAKFENNSLVLRQIAQLRAMDMFGTHVALPVEVKYYLQPYRPDASYTAFKTPENFDRVGYFETAPLNLNGIDSLIHATRFNPTKKIVFAVSANTPADYKQAVKDGILYWNKVFGTDAIEVVDAPAGVTAPDAGYNVVQWINWPAAGFAYADAQMDPRTGEILHAQVFMTSVFAVSGKNKARDALKARLEAGEQRAVRISLRGFAPLNENCDRSMDHSMEEHLSELLVNNTDDAKALKMSQDYVREVIAHEIGHTLGLRHNFAGSLHSNIKLSERADIMKSYRDNDQAPAGVVPSSSVMEYQEFVEGAITGDQIARGTAALDYDVKAIGILYKGEEIKEDMPLFCTDSHAAMPFRDCVRFDIGTSPIEFAAFKEANVKNDIVKAVLNRFIVAKTPSNGAAERSVDRVILPAPAALAALATASRVSWLGSLLGKGAYLEVHRRYSVISPEMAEDVYRAEADFVKNEVAAHGGYAALLPKHAQGLGQELTTLFEQTLQKYSSGIGWADQSYSFSQAEQQIMISRARRLFGLVEAAYYKADIATLKTIPGVDSNIAGIPTTRFTRSTLADEYLTLITSRVNEYVMKTTGSTIEGEWTKKDATTGTETVNKVQLPTYAYPLDVRKSAITLASGITGEELLFAYEFRNGFNKALDDSFKTVFGEEVGNIKSQGLNRPALQWYVEFNQVRNN